jgi:cytochrome c oxidase subunit 4
MSEHIVSRKIYFLIFGALMVGTAATVIAANIDFGNEVVNTTIALTIAVTKATLVVLFFMHVRYSARIIWVLVASGIFWLAILMVITASDYASRNWASPLVPTAQSAPARPEH